MTGRSEALRLEVLRLKAEGLSQTAIAGRVNRSQARVCQILRDTGVRFQPQAGNRADERLASAIRSSDRYRDGQDLDVRLDLLLGAPENLVHYQDCIEGARFEGARRREVRA